MHSRPQTHPAHPLLLLKDGGARRFRASLPHGLKALRASVYALALSAQATTAAFAATPLQRLYVSPDTAVVLGGQTVLASQVARDEVPVTTVNLGSVPAGANVAAYHRRENGEQLFVLDVTAVLPGGITAGPRDVVAFVDPGYAIVLDGAARGIPSGAAIDALATVGDDLLVSFDTTVIVGNMAVDDLDLVRVTPTEMSIFAFITGTGVVHTLDLDGVERLRNGHMLLSFDGSGRAKGIDFDDDDLIEYDPVNETFELVYDGVARHAAWAAADVDAVAADEPMPTVTPSLTATATQTPTSTAVPTSTPVPTSTLLPSDTPEPTRTPEPPVTSSPTLTFSRVPTTTPTATPSVTRTPTGSPTASATLTATLLPGFLAGDANCDDAVTAADVPALVDLIGTAASACGSDVNCDGSTDADDLGALAGALFSSPQQCSP